MRIRRQPAAGAQLAAEVLEVRLVDPAFEVGARVDARRGVPWKKMMSASGLSCAAEEMIEADFVQRRRRRVRRDVAADALFRLVRAHDHRHRIPADQALDAALDIGVAGHRRLLVGRNRVDVRRVGGERQLDAVLGRVKRQLAKQPRDFDRAAALQHIIERLEPFAGFDGIEICGVFRSTSFGRLCLTETGSFPRSGGPVQTSRHGPESRHAGTSSRLVDCVGWPVRRLSVNHSLYRARERRETRCAAQNGLRRRLLVVQQAIITCERCPRLRDYCRRIGREKRRAFRDETYWARPVPGFGDPQARLLIVGLAPAAHGANRTGRVFTGDGAGGSGDFLMARAASRRLRQHPDLPPSRTMA